MAKEVSSKDFQQEVIDHKGPVLVDFYATWCNPCKKVAGILDTIMPQLEAKAKVVKVNIEESSDLASQYMVMSIPALILFKEGKPQEKIVGLVSEREILKMVSNHS